MKRKLSILLCGTLAAGMLTACGGKKEMTGSETNAKSTGEEETVTIWHDGDEAIMGVIEDTVNKKIADENVSIKFEKKTGLTDQLKLYGNDQANGPDMYLYAHDSLG